MSVAVSYIEVGPRRGLSYFDTEFSCAGGNICLDYDFATMEQAATNGIDIMWQPSSTWKPMGAYHAEVYRLQAVQQRLTMVRYSHMSRRAVC